MASRHALPQKLIFLVFFNVSQPFRLWLLTSTLIFLKFNECIIGGSFQKGMFLNFINSLQSLICPRSH